MYIASDRLNNYKNSTKLKTKTIDFYYRSIWLSISRMYAPLAAKYGLTVTSVLVLINIDKKRGNASTKIAPEIGLESKSIGRVLNLLEKKGLIEKYKPVSDKRHMMIKLTRKGIEYRSIAVKYIKQFHTMVTRSVSESDMEAFLRVSFTINKLINGNKIHQHINENIVLENILPVN